MIAAGALILISGAQLVLAGDATSLLLVLVGMFVIAPLSIWYTRRAMARGRTPEQMINWWFNLPVIGRLLRWSDQINSRGGRGSKEILEATRSGHHEPREREP